MSTARQVLSNTASQFIGRLMTAVLSIIVIKLITNYLGKDGYGEYTTIYEFIGFFAIFADLGIYTVAVHEMSRDRERAAYVIGNIMGLRQLLSVLMMLLAILCVFLLPQYAGTHIRYGVVIATLTTFLTLAYGTVSSVLQIHYKLHYAALAAVLGKIVTVGYIFLTIFWIAPRASASGFYHLIFAGVIGGLVMHLMTALIARKLLPYQIRFDLSFWRQVIWKSAPAGIALLLSGIYFRLDILMLSLFSPKNNAMDQTGIYGVAIRVVDMLTVIPVFFMNSVLPILTRLVKDNIAKSRKVIQYAWDFLFLIGLPLVVGGFLLAKEIVLFISSEPFMSTVTSPGSDTALRILLLAMFFTFLGSLFSFLFLIHQASRRLLIINLMATGLHLLCGMIGLTFWDFRSVALASVIAQSGIFFAVFFGSKKLLYYQLDWRNTGKIILAAGIMGLAVYYLNLVFTFHFVWMLTAICGALIYGGILWLTGVINKASLAILKKSD